MIITATNRIYVFVVLMLLVCFTGCLPKQSQFSTPAGFAVYPHDDAVKTLKAVSPDGVVFRIKTEPNEPKADLSFWKEALKKRMLNVGYVFVRESDIRAGTNPGYLLELAAPVGAKDYAYLIVVFIDPEDNLIIVESAGEVMRFAARRNDIISAIQKIL